MPKGGIPDRWNAYVALGCVIADTRFIPFKVPLKESLCGKMPDSEKFTPSILLSSVQNLGLVIDLTNTRRYYDAQDITNNGIGYEKIFCQGRGHIPHSSIVNRFFSVVQTFLKKNKEGLIGVHCTHGLNRTGYLICRYMVENLGYTAKDAVNEFNKARGHDMERAEYLEHLYKLEVEGLRNLSLEEVRPNDRHKSCSYARQTATAKGNDRNSTHFNMWRDSGTERYKRNVKQNYKYIQHSKYTEIQSERKSKNYTRHINRNDTFQWKSYQPTDIDSGYKHSNCKRESNPTQKQLADGKPSYSNNYYTEQQNYNNWNSRRTGTKHNYSQKKYFSSENCNPSDTKTYSERNVSYKQKSKEANVYSQNLYCSPPVDFETDETAFSKPNHNFKYRRPSKKDYYSQKQFSSENSDSTNNQSCTSDRNSYEQKNKRHDSCSSSFVSIDTDERTFSKPNYDFQYRRHRKKNNYSQKQHFSSENSNSTNNQSHS